MTGWRKGRGFLRGRSTASRRHDGRARTECVGVDWGVARFAGHDGRACTECVGVDWGGVSCKKPRAMDSNGVSRRNSMHITWNEDGTPTEACREQEIVVVSACHDGGRGRRHAMTGEGAL